MSRGNLNCFSIRHCEAQMSRGNLNCFYIRHCEAQMSRGNLNCFIIRHCEAPLTGVPDTPRVVGRGGVAEQGQGIPTGYAYRAKRTTTTWQSQTAF